MGQVLPPASRSAQGTAGEARPIGSSIVDVSRCIDPSSKDFTVPGRQRRQKAKALLENDRPMSVIMSAHLHGIFMRKLKWLKAPGCWILNPILSTNLEGQSSNGCGGVLVWLLATTEPQNPPWVKAQHSHRRAICVCGTRRLQVVLLRTKRWQTIPQSLLGALKEATALVYERDLFGSSWLNFFQVLPLNWIQNLQHAWPRCKALNDHHLTLQPPNVFPRLNDLVDIFLSCPMINNFKPGRLTAPVLQGFEPLHEFQGHIEVADLSGLIHPRDHRSNRHVLWRPVLVWLVPGDVVVLAVDRHHMRRIPMTIRPTNQDRISSEGEAYGPTGRKHHPHHTSWRLWSTSSLKISSGMDL